jgi:hypothetical protein
VTAPIPPAVDAALRAWERAIDKRAAKQIDAAACGTDFDRRRAHEAADLADEAEAEVRRAIAAALAERDDYAQRCEVNRRDRVLAALDNAVAVIRGVL